MPFTFYAAFLGALISSVGILYLALKGHDPHNPLPVSQIVSQKQRDLNLFRLTIWIGGTLIAVTMFFFIIPRINYATYVGITCAVVYICELSLSIIPDNHLKKSLAHSIFGYSMGLAMLSTASLFAYGLPETYGNVELVLTSIMLLLAILTVKDSKRFMFYEMAFIGMSHTTVLVATVALR